MFHNSTAIRPLRRRNGRWRGEELSTIDKDETRTELTLIGQELGGEEDKDQIIQVNPIPYRLRFPVQGRIEVQPHNSTALQPLSGPRTRILWPGEDISFINNGNNGTRANDNNGGVTDVFHPTHQSSIQAEIEGGHQENEEHLTFSLEELGLSPEELETLTHPNISKNGVNQPTRVEGSGGPQGKKMAVEGVLQLPTKKICMGSRVREINLKVKYGTATPVLLRMNLNRLMYLLNLISIPQPPPPSSSQEPEPEEEGISDSDSPPTTPSSSSSGSDNQRVPQFDQGLIHDKTDRPGLSKNKNKKKPKPKPITKVKLPKGRGVPYDSAAKAGGKDGWRYSCYFCTKRCRALSHLNEHISIHTGEKPFPCDKCTQRFNTNGNLNAHKRLHALDPSIRRPFNCQECGKSFTKSGNWATHVKVIHRGVKDYKCLKCHKLFGTKSEMMIHHDAIHLKIRHPCPKPGCGKSFTYSQNLTTHIKRVHRGVKDVKCLKCDKMFPTNWEMMIHHNAIHAKIRHPCPKSSCGKTFSGKRNLQKHLKHFHPKEQPIPE